MRNISKTAIFLGSAGMLAGFLALASPGWAESPLDERTALRAVAQARFQEVLTRRSERDPASVAADAKRLARFLSDEQLRAIAEGEDAEPILNAAAELRQITGNALGDNHSDLLFVPVTPCRIIDTRLGSGGRLLPGVVRDFQVLGKTEFQPQGGNMNGCGLPDNPPDEIAAAVMMNFFAVNPQGSGTIRAWAYGDPVPLAAAIVYDNLGQFFSITNGLIVPVVGGASVPANMQVRADFNATHLAVDVTGYFIRFPIEQFESTQKTITEISETGAVDLSSGACTEVSSCTITSGAAGKVIVRAWAQIKLNHGTDVGGDRIAVGVKNENPTLCTNNDQSINATDYEVPDSLPADADVDWTLSHKRIFAQAKGTRTYYINARMITGGGAGDEIEASRMICTFIPD
jgi:hypothetical protein